MCACIYILFVNVLWCYTIKCLDISKGSLLEIINVHCVVCFCYLDPLHNKVDDFITLNWENQLKYVVVSLRI